MIRTIRTMAVIMLALALVAGPALAQKTTAGAGAAAGTDNRQTFSLGGYSFTINTINQVDAMRLQEMGVHTVTVPAGKTLHVTYSTGKPLSINTGQGPTNMIAFGSNGYAGSGAMAGAGSTSSGMGTFAGSAGPIQTYAFTGTAGQYYVITERSDGTRDMVLVNFE